MPHTRPPQHKPEIWWSNALFFLSVHLAAFLGLYQCPPSSVPNKTLALGFIAWQLAVFGITVGYHRLYAHRAFRATRGVRVVAAILGTTGFQGSIKWWSLRHRLHHRFTDDPIHDPYAATRGLFYSHVGWIFYKPRYEKMDIVDREDLEKDPVVRFQHKHYVALAIFFGFVAPTLIGLCWNDPVGAFVYGGLTSKLAIWHCTFLVNSLAHWDGLQPYSDEDTSRGNLLLALLTGGEGNHNYHTFPHDFRSGPSRVDWDPSKWLILSLQKLGLVTGLRRARTADITDAVAHMKMKAESRAAHQESEILLPMWAIKDVETFASKATGRCVVVIDGLVVDATSYIGEHPGGASLLRRYAFHLGEANTEPAWKDAGWAFDGGLNNHSRSARRRMKELAIAKVDL